jgi:hypothetical protein
MKIHLKFDHEKNDTLGAIECQYTGEQVNDRLCDLVGVYLSDDNMRKKSHLAELIHKTLDYEEILFLAMHSVKEKVDIVQVEILKRNMKDLLDL